MNTKIKNELLENEYTPMDNFVDWESLAEAVKSHIEEFLKE